MSQPSPSRLVHAIQPAVQPTYVSFLDAYPHPAFILSPVISVFREERCWSLSYVNPSLLAFLHEIGSTEPHDFIHSFHYPSSTENFHQWIADGTPTVEWVLQSNSGHVPISITKTKVEGAWVCVTVPRPASRPTPQPSGVTQGSSGTSSTTNCIIPSPHTGIPSWYPESTRQLLQNFDWSKSRLGPRQYWPSILRDTFDLIAVVPFPAGLWWGEDIIGLYNDKFNAIAGTKHPHAWGRPMTIAWPETWAYLQPQLRAVFEGHAQNMTDQPFFINRMTEDFLEEEVYLSWSYTPIRDNDGTVLGFLTVCIETTEKVIAKRRMNCLRNLIDSYTSATCWNDFSGAVVSVLSQEENTPDVPFAALYRCTHHSTAVQPSLIPNSMVNISLELAGTVGIPVGHTSVPSDAIIEVDLSGFSPRGSGTGNPILDHWCIDEAIRTRQIVHLYHLDESLISGFASRGWGDRCREAVVIPIGLSDQSVPSAILVLGLNTRRPYDAVYTGDMEVMRMTLSSALHITLNREADAKRAEQLAELDAAKTAFFSNASHELRTPLTLISGPLEDCIRQVSNGPLKQRMKMAQRNVYRLRRLVDSLMDFSRLAANRLEGQFRPVQLGLLTAGLASFFQAPIEKGGLMYRVECDTSQSQPVCYVDPDLWEKIVFNIVGNAFKYTLEGSITVSVSHTSSSAVFTVQDSGEGIPEEDIDKIFERFHRVQSIGRSHEGTGIGLALTKELVGLHGGRIAVESRTSPRDNHGTRFEVTIPLGKEHLAKANIFEEKLGVFHPESRARGFIEEAILWSDSSSSSDDQSLEFESKSAGEIDRLDFSTLFFVPSDTILIVDDNPDMRRYLKAVLSRYCTVMEARNGEEALDMISNNTPDLILSDVMMPVMDGRTLLNELRSKKETNLIPLIFITAKAGEDSQVEGLLSGADDYLVKPFKSTELVARVHLQMQLGKKRVEMEDKFFERMIENHQLTELSPVGILRADSMGRIIYVNPRWYDIADCLLDGAQQWLDCVYPKDLDNVSKWWQSAFKADPDNTTPKVIEFRWRNGRWCQGQCVSLKQRGALGAFSDINGQKELEEIRLTNATEKQIAAQRRADEAEERRKEAEEQRRAQELFIDVTSHELRQPVSAILNSSSLVRANLLALYEELPSSGEAFYPSETLLKSIAEDLDALDAIYQCGIAQERIANDVLSLSRIQLNGLSIHYAEFDLVEEVHRIASLFQYETRMKRIQLNVGFGPSFEQLGIGNVSSDKARFAQIITNLLSNAIKFTDLSTERRQISLEINIGLHPPLENCCTSPECMVLPETEPSETSPVYVFVSVTDSGPGLDPKDLALLFQRFQQGSNSHNVFGGSGLGLFVSKQLCSLMGGRIEVLSSPGNGATFRFFIRARAASPTFEILASPPHIPVKLAGPDIQRTIHVLITEDNLINQNLLNRQLTRAGCKTTLASNGRQAIDILLSATEPFDVVLMDVEMPVLDGTSAVREIREMEATGKLLRRHRIIALTANAREGQMENIRRAGMDDIVIKPYRIESLLNRLRGPPS